MYIMLNTISDMIENMIYLIMPRKVTERRLLFLTGLFCFVFSSLADNITATLVSCSLILSLPFCSVFLSCSWCPGS